MKRWNRRGVEGIPLKLMLVSLMVSLSVPAVMGSLENYEVSVAKASLISSAEELADAATNVLVAGEGNVKAITVEISSAASRGNGCLEVGGSLSDVSSLGVRCVYGGAVFHTEYMSDPPVRLIAASVLSIGPGTTELSLSCVRSDDRLMVLVEAVD